MANIYEPSKRRKRSDVWTDAETYSLISLWSAYHDCLRTEKRNRHVYETIAQRLNFQSEASRTWLEVKTKIANLSKEYRREKLKENNNLTSEWRFWMQVNSILSAEPLSSDVTLMDDIEDKQEMLLDVPLISDVQSILPDYSDPSVYQKTKQIKQSTNASSMPVHTTPQKSLPPSKRRKKEYAENEKYIGLLKELVQQQKHFQEEQQASDQMFLTLVQETVQLHNRSLKLQENIFEALTSLQKNRVDSVEKETFSLERKVSEFKNCDDSRYMDILTELVQQQGQYQQDQQQKDKIFVSSMQETVILQKRSFTLQEKMLALLKDVSQK